MKNGKSNAAVEAPGYVVEGYATVEIPWKVRVREALRGCIPPRPVRKIVAGLVLAVLTVSCSPHETTRPDDPLRKMYDQQMMYRTMLADTHQLYNFIIDEKLKEGHCFDTGMSAREFLWHMAVICENSEMVKVYTD